MTTGKRALIVDDSRSARVILSRMLEQHGMAVDTAESAEQALEYLRENRPDVIFMDHLMPGMDGFQAVQAIKADTRTATVPLMMYTSQEGELYVSQARALGAVGVLPKTVRPADVSRVLYQLHLLPDRRQDRTTLFHRTGQVAASSRADLAQSGSDGAPALSDADTSVAREGAPPVVAITPSELSGGLRQSMEVLLKEQATEQRRFVLSTFEAFARRLSAEIREYAEKPPASADVEPLPLPPPPRPRWPAITTIVFLVVAACVLGLLYWRQSDADRELAAQVSELRADVAKLVPPSPLAPVPPPAQATEPPPAATASVAAPAPATTSDASAQKASVTIPRAPIEYVPYGEVPFAGRRLERLQSLAATLEAQQFHGRIVAEYSVGDFCLTGSQADGFVVADVSLPFKKCDTVGNPFDDSLSPAQRESLNFANFVATLSRRTNGGIAVEATSIGRRNPVDYPEQADSTTAGSWNAVAAQNNRVSFRVVPAE